LAKLRNECNTTTKLQPEIANNPVLNPIHIIKKKKKSSNLQHHSQQKKAQHQCSKAIDTIVGKSITTLSDKLREKENKSYDKSPKHYHNNLKISAGLLPRARNQPRVTTLTNPIAKTTHIKPQEVIDIITSHYQKGKKRATLESLSMAPWAQPQNWTTSTSNHHYTTPQHIQRRPSITTPREATMIER